LLNWYGNVVLDERHGKLIDLQLSMQQNACRCHMTNVLAYQPPPNPAEHCRLVKEDDASSPAPISVVAVSLQPTTTSGETGRNLGCHILPHFAYTVIGVPVKESGMLYHTHKRVESPVSAADCPAFCCT
jgi:hypothetical protein